MNCITYIWDGPVFTPTCMCVGCDLGQTMIPFENIHTIFFYLSIIIMMRGRNYNNKEENNLPNLPHTRANIVLLTIRYFLNVGWLLYNWLFNALISKKYNTIRILFCYQWWHCVWWHISIWFCHRTEYFRDCSIWSGFDLNICVPFHYSDCECLNPFRTAGKIAIFVWLISYFCSRKFF